MLILIQTEPQIRFLVFEEMTQLSEQGWSPTEFGDWIGFYDVLRKADGSAVGVRVWPFEEAAFPLSIVDTFHVQSDNKSICFLFGNSNNWDESYSGDQLLEHASIVRKGDRCRGILLSLSALSDKERSAIAAAIPDN